VRVAAASSGYGWLEKEPLALIAGFLGCALRQNTRCEHTHFAPARSRLIFCPRFRPPPRRRRRWFAPSNIGVPALGGQSLFGAFMGSIGEELAHFPAGPAVTDSFWLYLISWHVGLFVALTLGQIGIQGRKQNYF
jgi:photosystem I subunit PsaO